MKNVLRGYQSIFGDITEKELDTIQAAGKDFKKACERFQKRKAYTAEKQKENN